MKGSRLAALFSMSAAVACGPAETLPPHDGGPPTGDAGEMCVGECVPFPTASWAGPALVWMGAEADAPHCPAVAPNESFTGYGYPDVPITCSDCICGPPSGWCDLKTTLTAAAASCADDGSGVAHTSFDPPASWGGTCNDENAIPAGKLCGGVPCVQSVTIAPLTVKQTGCLPIASPPVDPPPLTVFARGCLNDLNSPRCTAHKGLCVTPAPGPEFKQCVSLLYANPDEVKCSPDYPNRSFFYEEPTPKCLPCACEPPTGSTCTGSISLFQDSTCGAPVLPKLAISAMGPTCADVPPGSALGSKLANSPSYKQGTCTPSGGGPVGRVLCCRP